jgi:hypothetical protein
LWSFGLSYVVVEEPTGFRMPALVAFAVDLGLDSLDGPPRGLALSTAQLSSNTDRVTAVQVATLARGWRDSPIPSSSA